LFLNSLKPELDSRAKVWYSVPHVKQCEAWMERPLTVEEAAVELGYHPNHLRRLLRSGTMKGERFHQTWMLDPAEVDRIKALQGKGGRLPKGLSQD
jgi:excisionase family DNA binding protein